MSFSNFLIICMMIATPVSLLKYHNCCSFSFRDQVSDYTDHIKTWVWQSSVYILKKNSSKMNKQHIAFFPNAFWVTQQQSVDFYYTDVTLFFKIPCLIVIWFFKGSVSAFGNKTYTMDSYVFWELFQVHWLPYEGNWYLSREPWNNKKKIRTISPLFSVAHLLLADTLHRLLEYSFHNWFR